MAQCMPRADVIFDVTLSTVYSGSVQALVGAVRVEACTVGIVRRRGRDRNREKKKSTRRTDLESDF